MNFFFLQFSYTAVDSVCVHLSLSALVAVVFLRVVQSNYFLEGWLVCVRI